MQTIKERLNSGGITQTIFGLGGVGKTQIAIEYAYLNRCNYTDAVWIFSAETEKTLQNSCLAFAEKFGLIPEGVDEARKFSAEELGERLKKWCASHNSWLLIFDNVEQRKVIESYIPGVQTGHILITTRIREVCGVGFLEVGRFEPEEAVNFIHKRLDSIPNLINNESDVITLIERLGRFPLALEQAAAYMQNNGKSCSEYLKLLDSSSRLVKVLKRQSSACRATDYQSNVIDVLALTFEKLDKDENPSAKQLLNLCAYMSSDAIPLDFFKRQLEILPTPLSCSLEDELEMDDIVAKLLNYSLVERSGNILNIHHRLVQEIRREQLKDDITEWLHISVTAMLNELSEFDYGYREHRDCYENIVAHAESVASHLDSEYINNTDNKTQITSLYHKLGDGYYRFQNYDRALEWYRKELELLEMIYGKEHINTTEAHTGIASAKFMLGSRADAQRLHERVLELHKENLGIWHIRTARAYNSVASVHARKQEYDKAFALYQQSLCIMKELNADARDIANVYNDIGWTYKECKDYPEARIWYGKALGKRRSVLSEDHADIALVHFNVAATYYEEEDYEKALELYLESYRIRLKVLGDKHDHTIRAWQYQKNIYYDKLEYTEPFEKWLQEHL